MSGAPSGSAASPIPSPPIPIPASRIFGPDYLHPYEGLTERAVVYTTGLWVWLVVGR